MQLSTIIRLLRGLAKAAFYALILAGLLFVGLTQTDRGRQLLNTFLVDRFNARYAGTLRIDEIDGTFIGNIYARDIELLDPEGRVAATADAIEIAPEWLDLLRRRLTVGQLTVESPIIHLVETSDDSAYTLIEALRPRDPSPNRGPWRISAAQIDVRNGEVHTIRQQSDTGQPASWFFDYTNASLDSIDIQATVEWSPESKLVDLQSLSAYNRDLPLRIENLQGQFLADTAGFALNQVALQTSESTIAFEGSLHRSALRDSVAAGAISGDPIALSLRESTLSGEEVSSLFPGFSLQDSLQVAIELGGSPDALSIDRLWLSRGATSIDGTGTLERGADSLAASFQAHDATLHPGDVAAVWPAAPLASYTDVGSLAVRINSRGVYYTRTGEQTAPGTRFTSTTELAVEGAVGSLSGDFTVRAGPDRRIDYDVALETRELDLGRLQGRPELASSITGAASISGSGLAWDTLEISSNVALSRSRLGSRSIDSANVDLNVSGQELTGTGRLFQPSNGGFLYGKTSIQNLPAEPSYSLYLAATDLDLKPLLPTDTVSTRLNGSVTIDAARTPTEGITGGALVSIDSSLVRRPEGEYTVRPAVSEIELRPRRSVGPRLTLRGDLFDLKVEGDFTVGTLLASSRLWASTFQESLRQIQNKPRTSYDALSGTPLPAWPGTLNRLAEAALADTAAGPSIQPAPNELREQLIAAGLPRGTNGSVELHVRRTELLTTLLPSAPTLRGSLRSQMSWKANQDSIRLNLAVQTDTLGGPRLRLRDVSGQLDLSTVHSTHVIPATTDLNVHLRAGYLERPFQTFRDNELSVHYSDRHAAIQVRSGQIGEESAFHSNLDIALLDDRNRVTVQEFALQMRSSIWRAPERQIIDLYEDAVVFRRLKLQNEISQPPGTADSVQSVAISGALSSHPSDTARVRAQNVRLGEFSRILALNNPIGGILSADVTLTQGADVLETTGSVTVGNLTYDAHPLGQLHATSSYNPSRSAININANIAHEEPLPNGIQNDVSVSGTVGLPRRSTNEVYLDPGFLNLEITAREADLFFFENIFPGVVENVQATTAGRAVIRGNFRRPIFKGRFTIAEGSRFYQPDFNLNYSISGPVTVGEEGFGVDGLNISDPTGGSAELSGNILFNEYEYFSFDLQAQLDQLQTINVSSSRELPFYGQIWSSGTAYLTGPLYDALLRSPDVVTTPDSELYIPVTAVSPETDDTFIVFADSTGKIPEIQQQRRRENILADRPPGERPFLEGLDMNLNIEAPRGSTVHLVFDPLLGDVVEAVGSARVQLGINEGDFTTFGTFNITGGEYLFTAGDMFSRRFELSPGGTITWDGDPIDAQLDIPATYQTRASLAGLPGYDASGAERIPVVIELRLTGRVTSPVTDLQLAIDREEYTNTARITSLEPILNDEERAAEYATSVLLTNSFRLTLTGDTRGLTESVDQLAFSTLSQLVANQLNRFINHALSNVDVNLGVQRGTTVQDLDVTYGVALYLLDERLIIRGQGVYETSRNRASSSDNLQGRLTVEIRLSPTVSMEVFYRREEGLLESASTIAPTYGAGVSYQTDFTNWRQFLAQQWRDWKEMWRSIFDFLGGGSSDPPTAATSTDSTAADSVAQNPFIYRDNSSITIPTASDSLSRN